MTSDRPGGLLGRIAAANVAEVRQDTADGPIFWRVRRLGPGEAARAGVLEGLVMAEIAKADPPKMGRMAGSDSPSMAQAKAICDMTEAVPQAAVTGVREEGGEWVNVRLVPPEQEDPAAGLLSVASLSADVIQRVVMVAIAGAQGAGDAVASFPGNTAQPTADR